MTKVSKIEKKALKQKRKEEKAAKKAERIREKEHKKEIERLNKMLSPVSRKTFNSLGIIAFDSKVATIRKTDNNWIKTYKIEGMTDENRNEFIDGLMKIISVRARISSNFKLSESGRLVRTDFITFFVSAEIYETVKLALDAEVEKINNICNEVNLVEISLNCYMNQVKRNFLYDGEELDFKSMTKRKNDWLEDAFENIILKDDYFEINERIGACLQVVQLPGVVQENFLFKLLEINKPMMFITDIQPYSNQENEDLKEIIQRRFNQEIGEFENNYVNVGLTIVIITDDMEQKNAVIDDLQEIFCHQKMVIAPVYGNTADVLESSFSYGLRDYHSMRNIQVEQVKQLVV